LSEKIWLRNSELIGIEMNDEKQKELLFDFTSNFKREYELFPKAKTALPAQYYVCNNSFYAVDGEILYCMVRKFKPVKIIEIGSGFSTYLLAQAILRNKEEIHDYNCELTACDPFPNDVLKKGFPGLANLIVKNVQDIPLSYFSELKAGDIIFIDSSHMLKIGSDVQYEYLEILPRLNNGVIVHIHDIFLPAEYPRSWVMKEHYFWNEQYLLQAFLTFNHDFSVLWGSGYMHLKYPDLLENSFLSYKKEKKCPSSFWLRKM
jgi:predicted O-methyltransferase YrrM